MNPPSLSPLTRLRLHRAASAKLQAALDELKPTDGATGTPGGKTKKKKKRAQQAAPAL